MTIHHKLARSMGHLESGPELENGNGKLSMDENVIDQVVQDSGEYEGNCDFIIHVAHW